MILLILSRALRDLSADRPLEEAAGAGAASSLFTKCLRILGRRGLFLTRSALRLGRAISSSHLTSSTLTLRGCNLSPLGILVNRLVIYYTRRKFLRDIMFFSIFFERISIFNIGKDFMEWVENN